MTIVTLILLLGSTMLAFQFPSIQTFAAKKATDWLSKKTGYPSSVARVNIKWFDALSLEGVLIKDTQYRPMIEVGRLDLNHDFWGLITGKTATNNGLYLEEVMLYKPNVWLVFDKKTGQLNINQWIDKLMAAFPSDTTAAPTPNKPFGIKRGIVIDGVYRMDDPRQALMTGKVFDHNHFALQKINGRFKDFFVLGDTLKIDARNLSTTDQGSGLVVKELDTDFFMSAKKMEFGNLYGRVGNSTVRNYAAFYYNSLDDFDDFNNKVRITAQLSNTKVESQDLGYFANYLFTLKETWQLSGDFDGFVQDFKYKGKAVFGKNSRIDGEIAFKDVINYQHSDMKFRLQNSQIDAADVKQYYPEKSFNDLIQKFGVVKIPNGQFDGQFDNFNISGDYLTDLGNAKGKLKMDLRSAIPTYEGELATQEFDLGKLLDDPSLGKVNQNGKIKGRGFSVKDATIVAESRVATFYYNNYNYKNIALKGNFQKKYFEGSVSVRDSNLIADVDGSFDFSGSKYVYYAKGKVERANLRNLKLMTDSLQLHTELDIEMEGNTLDELVGNSKFLNSYATLGKRSLIVDTLSIDSRFVSDGKRRLKISSEFLNFEADGQFKPTQTVGDLSQLYNEYLMAFVGDDSIRNDYYTQKLTAKNRERSYLDYSLRFKKMDKLLAFLYPEGKISYGSTAAGTLTFDRTSMLSMEATFDTLKLENNYFYQGSLDLNSSKFTTAPDVLASVSIWSGKQQLTGISATEKMDVEASWEKDHIEFRSKIKQQNKANRAALNGSLRFVGDDIEIQFKKSKLQLLQDEWNIAANNLIRISKSGLTFSNLMMNNQKQSIALNGNVSPDSLQALQFETNNFQLSTLNPILNTALSGTLNGKASLRNLYQDGIYESSLNIKKLAYKDTEFGDLIGDATWDGIDKHLHLDIHLDKDSQRIISAKGVFDPKKTNDELDLIATLNNTDMKVIEPFTEGLISEIGGKANGTVSIKGAATNPKFDGVVSVQRGRLTFDYLKAVFAFEDKIYFDQDEIRVKRLRLTDPEGNVATFTGGVYYDGFENFATNFTADLKNFRILNTTIRDNEMFYGTAYGTGKFEMYGPINNLTITTNLTSNKGTKIYIPLDGAAEVVSQDFVQFVAPPVTADTTKNAEKPAIAAETNSTDFKIDLNLNMTPDAYCEIQLDRQTKHGMSAFGVGPINLSYDTRGKFAMSGGYEIKKGAYIMDFAPITKIFQIQSGSKINWTGDPYEALIDIKANYTALTSLKPILTNQTVANDPLLSRRYPIDLSVVLTERLSNPKIDLNIKFKEYPSIISLDVSAVEASLKSDEQYLKNQTASLLLFNQLAPQSADFLFQNSGTLTSNISNNANEFLNSKINNLASSISSNLEIGFSGLDFTKANQYRNINSNLWDDLQLRFSAKFLNDRLRITRDGRLSYGQNQYDATNLLLDWTLEYWFTEDGSQRLKAYSRNIQNQFTLSSSGVSYGVSFLYSRSFNNFKELETTPSELYFKLKKNDSRPLTSQVQPIN